MQKSTWLLLAVLVVSLSAVTIYYWGIPYVVEAAPTSEEQDIPASAPLQITFSRPMVAASVEERLQIVPPIAGVFRWEGRSMSFHPDAPWIGGQTVQVHLKAGAKASGLLALGMQEEYEWTFTVRSPRLAYLYPSTGPADIYLLNLVTTENERLTDSSGSVLDFTLTTNGEAIFYSVDQGNIGSSIQRLSLTSRELSTLVNCPQAVCRTARVSPDGRWLAYEQTTTAASGLTQIWLQELDPTGKPLNQPLQLDPNAGQTQQPEWSTKGWLSYYDFNQSSYIFRKPDSRELHKTTGQAAIGADWSPDGNRFVFVDLFVDPVSSSPIITGLITIPSSHLISFIPDEDRLQDLTQQYNLEDTTPVFSPDGNVLAFARKYLDLQRWTPGRQLWLMKPDGSQARPIAQEPDYNYYAFAWHPGSQTLAYVRFNENVLTEPPEIWLIQADGRGATRLVSGGYAPMWIP